MVILARRVVVLNKLSWKCVPNGLINNQKMSGYTYLQSQVTCMPMQPMHYIIEIVEITSCLQLLLVELLKRRNKLARTRRYSMLWCIPWSRSRVWTSMEVYEFYLENGGDSDMSKRQLIQWLSDVMGNKLLVLHCSIFYHSFHQN